MNKTEMPTVVKETKKKIRVDFERTPLLERLKVRFLSVFFLKTIIFKIFRLLLLIGISYIILFPFVAKITGSFMSPEDFIDSTVRMVPKYPTLNTYRAIIEENGYFNALRNTTVLSLLCAVLQMLICTFIGYGFSKFKFKGRTVAFLLVILTMIIPHQTIQVGLFMKFRYFDVFNIVYFVQKYIMGMDITRSTINFMNTYYPLAILSFTGLAFKNGLYIFMMRQFFKGVPDELEEASYVDGAGVLSTFFKIILPNAVPMMVTIFLFAFSWQWTDDFYYNLIFTTVGQKLLPSIVAIPSSLMTSQAAQAASVMYQSAINNTCGLMIIAPLILIYLFGQKFLIQGIERSGIVG